MTNILVVDDEPDARELIAYNLLHAGFEVTAAGTGEEAIRLARTCSPALILLDVLLPGMDGFEICRILRRDPITAQVPVIMLTALSTGLCRYVGLEAGANDYLTKPFSPTELANRIRVLLRESSTAPS